ncbi:4-phosphopantetheinyl transferase [Streptomyces venezuelae]|uniref:4'-phosphopantetheinyl transferase family protein n=1 Tax=Streptomyces venezuelae TaxID=54571 RepID=UPI00123C9082|nr:4'-phosphopantetheinyl transferase superfamily protein [Streptomyces venezuelae]QES16712.1 4-phosphopantetheinyl transferase [Streptomyces venezuelae]
MTSEISPVRVLRAGAVPDPSVPPVVDGSVALWLVPVTADPGAYELLDAGERQRSAALLREADRTRYLAAHGGLRRLLGHYLGTPPDEVVFVREDCPLCGGPHGRPAVRDGGIHFSLSHSEDLVLVGVAGRPVGVDVEAFPAAGVSDLVADTLHPREREEFARLAPEVRTAAFTRCWVRKEAYLKGTGEGLAGGLERTYVGTGPWPAAVPGWSLTDVPVRPSYAAAVALSQQ